MECNRFHSFPCQLQWYIYARIGWSIIFTLHCLLTFPHRSFSEVRNGMTNGLYPHGFALSFIPYLWNLFYLHFVRPSVSQSVHLRASQRVSSVICILIAFGFSTPVSSLFIIFSPTPPGVLAISTTSSSTALSMPFPQALSLSSSLSSIQFPSTSRASSCLCLQDVSASMHKSLLAVSLLWVFGSSRSFENAQFNRKKRYQSRKRCGCALSYRFYFVNAISLQIRWTPKFHNLNNFQSRTPNTPSSPIVFTLSLQCLFPTWPLSIEFLGLGRIRGAIRSACVSVWLCADFPSHFQLPFSVIFPLLALAAILGIFNR